MDRPDDLTLGNGVPGPAECEAILAHRSVEERIVRHSRIVSQVAMKLASSLVATGARLDLALVRAGGLLHDVAKGVPDHAHEGADLVTELGFPRVGRVISVHTDLDFQAGRLDEAAVVHLADKLVTGESIVSIEQRFQRMLTSATENPQSRAVVMRRLETAQRIRAAVEEQTGRLLQEILAEP